MIIKYAPVEPLEGKFLFLTRWDPPSNWVERVGKAHPGLQIVHKKIQWSDRAVPSSMNEDEWKDVIGILTFAIFPTPQQAPNLQLVQLMSAGANHVLDLPIFKDTKIPFCTANGVHPPQIAEWVICTFLAHQHHIPRYLNAMKDGAWKHPGTDTDIDDAVGRRVGILGYGSIGRQVARLSKALGMNVHAYTLHERRTPESRKDDSYTEPGLGDPDGVLPSRWYFGSKPEEISEFLSSGLDLLVVSLPLTKLTTGMISLPQFNTLAEASKKNGKRPTYISNIARGPIINTDDLITALDEELISGAALDVTDPEPLPKDHPLWKKKEVIITPHVSGNSNSYNERVLAILELNLQRLSEGKDPINAVNRKDGY